MSLPVTFVSKTQNRKLGDKVAATYSSIEGTCPDTCKLKDTTCYAQTGFVGIQVARLNKNHKKLALTATQIASLEATLIDDSFGRGKIDGRPLRLHVSGDVRTRKGVTYLANAAKRWLVRGGGKVWSYSHAWAKLPKSLWNSISVLASVDTIEEANEAVKAGYAPAIVVERFDGDKAFKMKGSDVKWIPCPNQTNDVTCVDCKLCLNADKLTAQNAGIAFAIHGSRKGKFSLKVTK
jgi:hypothetical protein